MHLIGIVDGPHMHIHSMGMGAIHKTPVDQCDPTGAGRDLDTATAGMTSTQSETRSAQSGHTFRTERCAQLGTQQLFHAVDSAIGEGSDADTLHRITGAEERRQWFDDGIVFRIDVDPQVGPGGEQFLQQWDRFPAIYTGATDLAPFELLDHAIAVGDPVESVVVEGEDLPVSREVCIGLDVSIAEGDGPGERGHGVLGPFPGAATVGEGNGAGVVEEGVR